MSLADNLVNVGTVAYDRSGDKGDVPFKKYNAAITELYGWQAAAAPVITANSAQIGLNTTAIVALQGATTLRAGNFASPSIKVGPAVVNGIAITAMRSDAAPAIDLTADYPWSGAHTFSGALKATLAPVAPIDVVRLQDLEAAATPMDDPTGLIGMGAVNGIKTTSTRSDSTHAIDPAITPAWTGEHSWDVGAGTAISVISGKTILQDLNLSGLITGKFKRAAVNAGYMDGNYTKGGETSASPGCIYTIGDTYLPTATGLGTMYGIGYTYSTVVGQAGVPASLWGMYVAQNGASGIFLDAGGNGYFKGTLNAVVLNATSDSRAKTHIRTIDNALGIIQQLNGVRFNWLEGGSPSAGLIAQDVELVLPELVTDQGIEGGIKSLNYNGIVGVLLAAVRELSAQVAELRAA